MKPTVVQIREVSRCVKKWRSILFLHDWHFETHHLHEKPEPGTEGDGAAAYIVMNQAYKLANIFITPTFWEQRDAQAREMMLCHELCHCIIKPLAQITAEAANGQAVSQRELMHWVEYVTQHVTNVVFYKS